VKNISKIALLRSGVAPLIMGAALVSVPTFAQEAQSAAEGDLSDAIVVTGSLIKNPNLERSTPVTATTADQIELKQNNTAEEILREIPGVVPSIGSAVNNGNGGASFVDLRGLGSNRNVVLLDGNRLVPAELNGRFDLNNVPIALVERVEVLTGGASTTYGADAISGVVNFITKSDFAGLEANFANQITEQGDGQYVRADLTLGANFDDGRGNVVFSVGYQQSDPVYQGDRPFSNISVDSFTGADGGSGTSTPSRFTNVNPTGVDSITANCGAAGQVACNAVQGNRQVTAAGGAFRTTTAFDAYNFNPFNIFQTPFERFNMYGAGRYEVSDAVEVYTRGIFSKNTVKTIIAGSGAFGIGVDIPLSNPYLSAAQRNAFCAFDTNSGVGYTPRFTQAQCDAAATAQPTLADGTVNPDYRTVTTTLSRRATEYGPRISEFTTTFFDYKVGARGGITDTIDWDVTGAYGESENVQTQKGYWLNSRVRQALLATNVDTCLTDTNGCVPLNVFGPDGSITAEQNAFLNANSLVTTKTSLAQAKATVSGDFGFVAPWASDAVAFAIGGEYRKYHASQESDLLSQSGDLGGAGGASPNIDGGYEVYEAYGELLLPLVQDKPFFQDLTLEAGIRYSDYKIDAAGASGYNTTTWKAGGSWTPVDGIKIRGNYAHAVRAPNIAELFSPVNTGLTNLDNDPCAGTAPQQNANLAAVCIAQGATADQIAAGAITNDPANQVNTTGGGNLNVGPEKSNSYTIGVVLQPTFAPGLSLTVDYYNIKITGAITSPTPGDVIDACFANLTAASASDPACTIIRRDPGTGGLYGEASVVGGLFQSLSNLGKLATDGIDVSLNYSKDVGFANWSLAATGNWTNSSTFQATPTSLNRECVGLYSVNCASIQPKFSWSVRNTLTFETFDLSLLWRYIDGVKSEEGDAYAGPLNGKEVDFNTIPAEHYFDLTGRFHASDEVTITLTVQNLLDNQPKVVGTGIGTTGFNSGNVYPSTYDALGRRYTVAAKFRF
jgi:iron complex outermembrane receptor protein